MTAASWPTAAWAVTDRNRGASFSLQSGAVNPLMPGRLPIHTLNPALAVLDDGRIMAYRCMGGDRSEPRRELFVAKRRRQPADAGATANSYAQSGTRRAR